MAVTFYPKRLLFTAFFIVAFGAMLSVATGLRQGLTVGALAVLAYLLIEVLIVFNPAGWWQSRRRS